MTLAWLDSKPEQGFPDVRTFTPPGNSVAVGHGLRSAFPICTWAMLLYWSEHSTLSGKALEQTGF